MGTNEGFGSERSFDNTFGNVIQGAIALAPLGVGAAMGARRIHANQGVRLSDLATGTRLGSLGGSVGDRLNAADIKQREDRYKRAQEFAQKLLDKTGLNEILQEVQDQQAVIQSMMSALDDPISGLDPSQITGYKERLMDAARNLTDKTDQQTVIQGLVNELYDNNAPALEVFKSRLDEFKRVGSQLTVPTHKIEPTSPFEIMPQKAAGLKGVARDRFDRIRGAIGGGLKSNMYDIVTTNEHTNAPGGTNTYLRLYRPGFNGQRQFATMLPLQLGQSGGYSVVRLGEAATAYRADSAFFDAQMVDQYMRQGGRVLSEAHLRGAGAAVDIEDFWTNRFVNMMSNNGGNLWSFSTSKFNASMREIMNVDDRMASMNTPLGNVVSRFGAIQQQTARLLNVDALSSSRARSVFEAFAGSPDFGYGVGADRLATQNIEGRSSFVVGRKGPYSVVGRGGQGGLLRTGFEGIPGMGVNRFLEPLTARAEQVTNRASQASMFVPEIGAARGSGLRGMLGAGRGNVLWGDALLGATNKAVLMDVRGGRLSRSLAGSGQAYSLGGADVVRSAFTKPISDPLEHGSLSSKMMERLLAMPRGTFMELTQAEMASGFIGVGPQGAQYLNKDPRRIGMRVALKEVSDAAGKRTLHLVGEMDRRMESLKIFGRLFKGTTMQLSGSDAAEVLSSYGVSMDELGKYGIGGGHTLLADEAMLKKSPASIMRQLSTGYGLVTGDAKWEQTLNKHAARLAGANGSSNPIETTTRAVIHAMGENKVGATAAGRVLAGVWHRATGGTDSFLSGRHEKWNMSQDAIRGMLRGAGMNVGKVEAAMEQGLAIGMDTFTKGEGVGDWKLGRASVEPRFFENLQQRLRGMGMSDTDTSEVIAGIYQNKMGYGDHLHTARNMMRMTESVKGMRQITEGIPGTGPTKMTLEGLMSRMDKADGNMDKVLAGFDEGIMLDMSEHSNARTQSALRSAAQNAFGGASEIYLPGGKAMEHMRGTFIKTTPGQPSIDVGSRYEKLLRGFGRDLNIVSGLSSATTGEIQATLAQFAKDSNLLTARAFHGVASGKIRGSGFHVAAKYDLAETGGVGLNRMIKQGQTSISERGLARQILKKTQGQAIWMDSLGFMSQLKDFMGNANVGSKEVSKKLETFFTGSEGGGVGTRKGLYSIGTRHPELSRGNVALTQIFRDVREVGHGAEDKLFQRIKDTAWGQTALKRFGSTDVSGFSGLTAMRHSHKDAVQKFFRDWVSNLDDFVSHEGGGRVFQAVETLDVHYSGKKGPLGIDFGLAAQAGGDWDGDQWGMILLNKRAGKTINSTLRTKNMDAYMKAETIYKVKSAIYADQAKEGLKQFAGGPGGMTDAAYRIFLESQDALKEKMSKEATGLLDVHLNDLRRAVLAMPGASDEEISGAQALLKVLEEHTTIKGKKLPAFRPWAAQLSAATEHLMKTGNIGAFGNVLRSEVFKNQQIAQGGVTIGNIGPGGEGIVDRSVSGVKMNLDAELEIIQKAVNSARSRGTTGALGATARQIARSIGRGGASGEQAVRDLLMSANSVQAGMVRSGRETVDQAIGAIGAMGDQILRAGAKINKQAMAPIMAGAAASIALAGVMGDRGYAPEPIMMPGEMGSPHLQSAMASGSVMNQNSVGYGADDLQRKGDRYAMMDRPINTNSTYMQKPNTFQVGVEAQGAFDYGRAARMIGSIPGMGMGSSIAINDTRRPITRNYYDRLAGEY